MAHLIATVSTLDNFKTINKRQAGNTSKQLKLALKLLRAKHTVQILDHWESGGNTAANTYLYHRVLEELENRKLKYITDNNRLIIKLK